MKPLSECNILPTPSTCVIYHSLMQGVITAHLTKQTLPDGRVVLGYFNEVDNLWIIKSRLDEATGLWEFESDPS